MIHAGCSRFLLKNLMLPRAAHVKARIKPLPAGAFA